MENRMCTLQVYHFTHFVTANVKITTYTHIMVSFSLIRPIIFLPYFCVAPLGALRSSGLPVTWTAWTPGFSHRNRTLYMRIIHAWREQDKRSEASGLFCSQSLTTLAIRRIARNCVLTTVSISAATAAAAAAAERRVGGTCTHSMPPSRFCGISDALEVLWLRADALADFYSPRFQDLRMYND